jgi:hypothetical protein
MVDRDLDRAAAPPTLSPPAPGQPVSARKLGLNLTGGTRPSPNHPVNTKPLSWARAGLLVCAAALCLVVAVPAAAAPNDISLNGLVDGTDPANPVVRNEDFRLLVRELGVIFTPQSMQPAETTGIAGFDFAMDYTFHLVDTQAAHWQDALEQPGSRVPMTLGARARKGFILPIPLASEVELGAQWLIESQMVNIGGNVRLALNEGFTGNKWWVVIPDIAVMAGINRVVGSNDLDLLTVTAGGSISKGFGVFGTFNLTPFFSYQSIWVNGSTRLIDADPSNTSNVDDNVVFDVVDLAVNRIDRYSGGVRVIVAHVMVTGGIDVNVLDPDTTIVQLGVRTGIHF